MSCRFGCSLALNRCNGGRVILWQQHWGRSVPWSQRSGGTHTMSLYSTQMVMVGKGGVPRIILTSIRRGHGRSSIMVVSDFICPCCGRLRLDNVPIFVISEPGKNHDGYWQATYILKRLEEKAIPAFDQMHPEARGLFVFDNSTNHGAYASGALLAAVASKTNLGPGGGEFR